MSEPTADELRALADRLRGRAQRRESEAAEHGKADEYGKKAEKCEAAALDRSRADSADALAGYLETNEEDESDV